MRRPRRAARSGCGRRRAERWNPLAHGNATELKDKLIATETFTEPHYQRAAERYVQTAMQVLERAHPDRAPVLDEVVALMEPRRLSRLLRDLDDALAARVQDYVASLGHDQLSAVRGLGTRLAIVSESQTGRFLRTAVPRRSTCGARCGAGGRAVQPQREHLRPLAAQVGTLAVQDLVTAAGPRLTEPGAATGDDRDRRVLRARIRQRPRAARARPRVRGAGPARNPGAGRSRARRPRLPRPGGSA